MIDCTIAALKLNSSYSLNTLICLELVIEKYFQNESELITGSWVMLVNKLGNLVHTCSADLLFQNKLFLCFHKYCIEFFVTSISVAKNSEFFQTIIKWFDSLNEQELNDSKLILCWGMMAYIGFNLMEKTNTSNHLELLARYV